MECKFERDEVTIVRDALSNSAIADDDEFGGDGKCINSLIAVLSMRGISQLFAFNSIWL